MSLEKASSGCPLLDEKIGGLKRGGVFLLLGPPLGGKKLFARKFVAKGLELGEGCIVSITNNTAEKEYENLKTLIGEKVSRFLNDGTLVYIDLYSRVIGIPVEEKPYFRRIPSIVDLASYNVALREVLSKMTLKEIQIRLVFDSISTLLLYNPFQTVSRFLHVLFGKLKSMNTVSLFLLEEEAHDKSQIATILGMCDGVISVKVKNGGRLVKYEAEGVSLEGIECD